MANKSQSCRLAVLEVAKLATHDNVTTRSSTLLKAWLVTDGPPSQRELVGGLRTVLEMRPHVSLGADSLAIQYAQWCESLGRLLAPLAKPLPVAGAVPTGAAKPVPPSAAVPAFDLEGALRRIEGLKRDGLLTEPECQVLRLKAAERAKAPAETK